MVARRTSFPGFSAAIGVPVLLGLALAAPAAAAGPGENILVSGLPGLAAPTPADFAWNESPYASDTAAFADVSANGRWVAFGSTADGLVTAAEDRRYAQVFVKDRQTGTLTTVTAGANGSSFGPTISDDGTLVAFETRATNLVPNDPTSDTDVVVRNLVTGTTTLVTDPGNDGCAYPCRAPHLSGNGSRVAFVTTAKLLPADDNDHQDVYTRLASGGGTVLVSRAAAAADGDSRSPTISDDGKIVAFSSYASNLAPGDGNVKEDVFVRDTVGAKTVLASAASGMTTVGNGDSGNAVLSGDGQYVAFVSDAANLGDGDNDATPGIHRRYVARAATGTGTTVLISRTPSNASANDYSYGAQISDDGSKVSFVTGATNLPAGIGQALLRDVTAGTTVGLGAGPQAAGIALSGDGALRLVVYGTFVPALEPGLVAIGAGVTPEVLSRPSSGLPLIPRVSSTLYDVTEGDSRAVSADGRFVVFASTSSALPGGAWNAYAQGEGQIYRRDNRTGEVVLVSQSGDGVPSPYGAHSPSISSDGNRVGFLTSAKLSADVTDTYTKFYVRDIAQATTTLASRPPGTGAAALGENVDRAQLSGGGGHVVFVTASTVLDPSGSSHVYVRDLAASTTVLADRANGAAGVKGNSQSDHASISDDGTRVAFRSWATNLVADSGSSLDLFVRDLAAGTTVLASRASGATGVAGNANSGEPEISGDGTAVAFETDADNLDPSAGAWPQNVQTQVAVRNLTTATTTLVSRGAGAGAVGNEDAQRPSISRDGRTVAYDSFATNLGNAVARSSAVFVRDVPSGAQQVIAITERSDPAEPSLEGNGTLSAGLSGDGRCVAFTGHGLGLVPDVSPDYQQVFMRVREGDCGTPASGGGGGGGGGNGGGGGAGRPAGPGTAPRAKPRLSGVRLTRTRFRVAAGRTATSRARRTTPAKRTPAGTTVRFTLSAPATVSFTISRPVAGRKVGARCRKATRALRTRRPCVLQRPEGTITRRNLKAGPQTLRFTGRVGRKALRSGKHELRVLATSAAGTSKAVTVKFTVVRR
ncbi:MAG: hypothetical protein WC558_07605 [Patulibacter sp.]